MGFSSSSQPPDSPENVGGVITLMLVDDSAVIRGLLSKVLKADPQIKIVSSVMNGELAIQAAQRHRPDVIIMDIEMPVMDGLTALPRVLKVSPDSKVIIFSGQTEKGASVTLEALALGATEYISKPSSTQDVRDGSGFQKNLLSLIRGLSPHIRPARRSSLKSAQEPTASADAAATVRQKEFQLRDDPAAYQGKPSIIAIGSSTGGPQALFQVLRHFRGFDVPVMLTQHMPATFTKILASHIEQQTSIPTHEGEQDMPVENGHIYVAPGGYHMLLDKASGGLKIRIDDGPQENFCKPSVDPMYRSIIHVFGKKTLGVILTGMGNDGLKGGKALVECGGRLIAQDEATSVIWGMPGAVAMAGLCSEVLPLDNIGPWIKKTVLGRVDTQS